MRRKQLVAWCAVALLLAPRAGAAQDPQNRVLPAAVGVVGGVAAGGYLAVAIVVLESRFGRYLHDEKDILGWRSVPVVAGALVGGGLGFVDPDRLYRTMFLGAAGVGVGVAVGVALGDILGGTPEARWAGGAMAGGAGLMIGNLLGILLPADTGPGKVNVAQARVPLMVRIPF
jgi:hypothetical protein